MDLNCNSRIDETVADPSDEAFSVSPHLQIQSRTRYILAKVYAIPTLVCLYFAMIAEGLPVENLETACLIAGIYCLVTVGLTLWAGGHSVFSFPGVFLGISCLYMLGLILVYPFQGDDAMATWYRVDDSGLKRGIPLVMLAFSCFLFGSFATVRRHGGEAREADLLTSETDIQFTRLLGGALYSIAIVTIGAFTVMGGGLSFVFEGGYFYLSEMQYQEGGAALLWGSLAWFLPWGVLTLAATFRRKQDLPWLILAAVPVNVIFLLTGDRGGLLVMDILLLIRAQLFGLRMSWWRTALAVGLLLVAVPTLMVLRQTPMREWSPAVFVEALMLKPTQTRAFSADPVSATLIEGGTSYKVLMGTVELVPSESDYHYGLDYLKSLATVVPFFSRVFPDLVPHNGGWVKEYVDHPRSTAGVGFLQVAEAYLQFGPIGVAVFFWLAGYGVTGLWNHCRTRVLSANQLAYTLIVMHAVLLWIRNEFHTAVRPIVWCFVLLIVLPRLLRTKERQAPDHAPTCSEQPHLS